MGLRIYLVDDDLLLRDLYRRFFVRAGYSVVGEGQAGPRLLEDVKRAAPDVVLLDLEMPGGSGCGYIQSFRDLGAEVIVLSGSAVRGWRTEALELGAAAALEKLDGLHQIDVAIRRATGWGGFHLRE